MTADQRASLVQELGAVLAERLRAGAAVAKAPGRVPARDCLAEAVGLSPRQVPARPSVMDLFADPWLQVRLARAAREHLEGLATRLADRGPSRTQILLRLNGTQLERFLRDLDRGIYRGQGELFLRDVRQLWSCLDGLRAEVETDAARAG